MNETNEKMATAFTRVNLALQNDVVGGVEMYTAVFRRESGVQVCIGTPTMEELKNEFYRITGRDLDVSRARKVICVRAP